MNPILSQIRDIGLVPVIKLNDPEKAVPLAKALKAGGIPVAEVTFRAAGADKAIAAIAKEMPDILVGAGTVVTIDQVKAAVNAGAKYIISPGFDEEIVSYCIKHNIIITPGCASAGDVSKATKLGLEVVKFFPAEANGGLKVLKALAGPFPKMRFIPTGGINPKNLGDYLAFGKIIACGGSWMVPADMVDNNDFDGITALAKQAVAGMLNVRLAHIGINSADDKEASETAKTFAALFGANTRETDKSYFASEEIEVMKQNGMGTKGHIALKVSDVSRAMRFFETQGFKFDPSTLKFDENGKAKFVYLKNEIGGFAVHFINA